MVRALVALAAASACLGVALAYASARPEGRHGGLAESRTVKVLPGTDTGTRDGARTDISKGGERLLRPRFIEYPEAAGSLGEPQFRFHVPPRTQHPQPSPPGPPGEPVPPRRFQCRLDGGDWSACGSPYRLADLAAGDHLFAVRAFNREGRPGPASTHAWRQLGRAPTRETETADDPKPFSIELPAGALADLYPGHPTQQLTVLIGNPNPVPIEVTGLRVAIDGDSPVCPAENFELTPSNVSPSTPLRVPAGGSVSLPSSDVSAPSIRMLDLPVNQDACRRVEIPLVFSGEARG